jgi:hypothetical protein
MRVSDGRLPTFLVIGAMKSGTDSLWHYLRSHPRVHMSAKKEPDFFVQELNWRRGPEWYRSRFAGAPPGAVAVGEASTSYSKHPVYAGVPARIARMLPDVSLIYLIRDPVERIRSQYQHQVLLGLERRPIGRAVLDDPSYVAFSSYAMQLERYLPFVDRDRILVVLSERLRDDRQRTLRQIAAAIGVDDGFPGDAIEREHHATVGARVPRRAVASMQGLPGYGVLSRYGPRRLKLATERLRTRALPAGTPFVIPADVVAELWRRLEPDVERLGSILGAGAAPTWRVG